MRLAAWFLWIIPEDAALSSLLTAFLIANTLFSSPLSAVENAVLIRVFNSDLTALFLTRRTSLVLFLLIWLLMFAILVSVSVSMTQIYHSTINVDTGNKSLDRIQPKSGFDSLIFCEEK